MTGAFLEQIVRNRPTAHISVPLMRVVAEQPKQSILERIQMGKWTTYKSILLEDAYEESWALGKAIEYVQSLKSRRGDNAIPLKKLITIFDMYDQAVQKGEKLPLKKFSEQTGIFPMGIARILKKSGLGPMYWTCVPYKRSGITEFQIKELMILGFRYSDLDFFNGTQNSVSTRAKKLGLVNTRHPVLQDVKFSFTTASKVYQKIDADEPFESVLATMKCDYKLTNDEIVYLLGKRPEISDVIMTGMRLIRPKEDVKKPYWV